MTNIEYLISVPDNEAVVGMVSHDDIVFVATDKRVYMLAQDAKGDYRFKPVPFDNDVDW